MWWRFVHLARYSISSTPWPASGRPGPGRRLRSSEAGTRERSVRCWALSLAVGGGASDDILCVLRLIRGQPAPSEGVMPQTTDIVVTNEHTQPLRSLSRGYLNFGLDGLLPVIL